MVSYMKFAIGLEFLLLSWNAKVEDTQSRCYLWYTFVGSRVHMQDASLELTALALLMICVKLA